LEHASKRNPKWTSGAAKRKVATKEKIKERKNSKRPKAEIKKRNKGAKGFPRKSKKTLSGAQFGDTEGAASSKSQEEPKRSKNRF